MNLILSLAEYAEPLLNSPYILRTINLAANLYGE